MPMPNQPKALRKLAVIALLTAAAGASAQQLEESIEIAYAKPGIDLAAYDKFLLLPLNVSDVRIVPPPWVENADPRYWNLTPENRDFLVSTFATAVRDGIQTSNQFPVVTNRQPGTLQVEVRLVSLTPWAAREEAVTTMGAGMLTFEAQIRDAQTAELIAIVDGTQQVGREYQENTQLNRAEGVTEYFTAWGQGISRRLAEARAH